MIAVPSELNYWLSIFLLEARKADGEHHHLTDTQHVICSDLQRFIQD
jgi:hypothetical protein